MIRYFCDIPECTNSVDTDEPKMPTGWTCDPVYRDGKYTGKMADVCPECEAKRKGKSEVLKPVNEAAVQQSRAKKRLAEDTGQRRMF